MSEVAGLPLDRETLLRSKRTELNGIVKSRKRKLRELYAVADTENGVPNVVFHDLNAHPTTPAEIRFLDLCDILQGRPFDESTLPKRQKVRSDITRTKPSPRRLTPEPRQLDVSLNSARLQPGGSRKGTSRATSPSVRSDGGRSTAVASPRIEPKPPDNDAVRDSTVNGTRSELGAWFDVDTGATTEEAIEDGPQQVSSTNDTLPVENLEVNRIRNQVESRPGSPGVDPRRAVPMTAEDIASLPGPLLAGFNDEHHKAATVHLPPKEDQEQRLREIQQVLHAESNATRLSINLPNGYRPSEVMSSPGSTAALSATTPALHDASTDTSPDESSRYEQDRAVNKGDPSSLPDVSASDQAAGEREQELLLQAQIDVSRADIFRSSPAIDQATAASSSDRNESVDLTMEDAAGYDEDQSNALTAEASEVVQDIADDEKEMAAEASRMEDHPMPDAQPAVERPQNQEVPDSEGDSQTPVDATTVKDSFESRMSQHDEAALTPTASQSVEGQPKASIDSQKSSNASTPRRPSSQNAPTPPLERMTTRVSSGAMRHKSVSEILGEIPRPNTSVSDRSSRGTSDPESATDPAKSPSLAHGGRTHSLAEKLKEKERSKLSTVVFARQFKSNNEDKALVPSKLRLSKQITEDYFMPLFLASASNDKARGQQPLEALLSTAHKTISTSNAYVPILEAQTVKVLKRIYTLQNNGKWSLRQPKRAQEPARPTSHWDLLMQEAKWMRTDFREERKWKMAIARNMAYACADWFAASPEERKSLQVRASAPQPAPTMEVESTEASDIPQTTPDLIAAGEVDSPVDDSEDEPRLLDSVAPTAIFGLSDNDVVFGLRRSPTSDKLLNELPMYGHPLSVPNPDIFSEMDADREWKRRALPLSKFIEGRLELKEVKPPRKRSRFEYEEDDDDDDYAVLGEPGTKRPCLEPEQTNVALFDPEYKHVRDRIHSAHHFRPPSEFPMPMQSFFECRIASQWTWAEDDELRNLVREYTYNWSLIANILSTTSMYASGAERRTPWECFERWIHLEGLPADMQKTHYFRAYNNRLEAANRTVMLANAQIPQGPNANGQVQPRRRQTTSVRVERRRNQKHLTMVDAMRKLAKKRETAAQKQAHAAQLAAMRKNSEVPTAKNAVHTPQDFSKLKHEREEQTRERMALLQQRQEAARRSSMQQRNAQQPGLPNGTPNRSNPANGMLPNGQPMNGQNLAIPGQRPRNSMSMTPNPLANNVQIPMMNGVPQAPMMNRGAGQIPMPNPGDLINQAQRVSAQQRQQIMQQQQGQHNPNGQMHTSPPRNSISQGSYLPNGMMQPPPMYQNTPPNANGGVSTPPPSFQHPIQNSHSPVQGPQGSPPRMMSQGSPIPPPIEAQIRTRNPNLTDAEVLQVYQNALKGKVNLAQQAMHAAAGGGTPRLPPNMLSNGMGGNAMNGVVGANGETPQQVYAHVMAARAQAARESISGNANGNGGGNANANGNGVAGGNPNQGNQGGSHAHSRSGSQGSSGGGQS